MQTEIKIGNTIYRIEIKETGENTLKVKVNNKEYFFNKDRLTEPAFTGIPAEDQKLTAQENGVISKEMTGKEIKSPLSGIVSSLSVKVGQKIKPGEKVMTLIAMKMENEIVAEGYGKIKEIKVKENQLVNIGDILIILE